MIQSCCKGGAWQTAEAARRTAATIRRRQEEHHIPSPPPGLCRLDHDCSPWNKPKSAAAIIFWEQQWVGPGLLQHVAVHFRRRFRGLLQWKRPRFLFFLRADSLWQCWRWWGRTRSMLDARWRTSGSCFQQQQQRQQAYEWSNCRRSPTVDGGTAISHS